MSNTQQKDLSEGIKALNNSIANAIPWTDRFLTSENHDRTYSEVVNVRRELKKISSAMTQNPSAVLYGESQVGKSYLIKNLLSLPEEGFVIRDETTGESYDFLENINPEGGGVEATSVVTRFSTNVEIIDSQFPIKIQILSPKDIALILADSYFSDVKDPQVFSKAHYEEVLSTLKDEFETSDHQQGHLQEDDILDIRDYLNEHFSSFVLNLNDAKYLDGISRFASKVPSESWWKLFQPLWNEDPYISKIFDRIISELTRLQFAETGYCKFEAVLRKNGTLLDVNRLHQIINEQISIENYIPHVDVLIGPGKVINSNKSLLCALTKEVVFKLDKSLEQSKAFLKNLDLLDFPGARSRLKLENEGEESVEQNMSYMVLRGKVAYIFNKYSAEYLISNLLFCNRSEQIGATYIPSLLNNWINKFIGANPAERQDFINNSKISPLFIIYTWFNKDLEFDKNKISDRESLNSKWFKRFNRIFETEIVTKDFKWDKNWTEQNPFFENHYLLRDFEYSNGIFKGFAGNGEETEMEEFPLYKDGDYYNDLKESFLNYDFVQKHFEDPEKAWEESATSNNDGSLPIIRNLNIAADNNARDQKFSKLVTDLKDKYFAELRRHFHDEVSDNQLSQASEKAGSIQLDMDMAIDKDPYFFGKLIQKLLIKESEIFNFYREQLRNIELVEETDINGYATIHIANPDLITVTSKEDWKSEFYEKNIEILQKSYSIPNREEVEQYFEEKGINLMDLFVGAANNIKTNSRVLAEGLADYWFKHYLVPKRFEEFVEMGLSQGSAEDLIDNIKANFIKVGLIGSIAESIRTYVDRYDKIDKVQQMIADISAAQINKFVNSMGYEYYSPDELKSLEKANDENDLGLSLDFSPRGFESMDGSTMEKLFDTLENLDELINRRPIDKESIKNVPSYSQYFKWRDLLRISFTACCDIPTYDVMANNELKRILEAIKE